MVKKKKIAIIGAGISGMAAGKVFKEKGHDISILERSHDLGGVWEPSVSYPDVQTQSPKDLYRYTDKAMPEDYPEWPKGPQVHAYINDYANDYSLREYISFNTEVKSMTRRADGKAGWTIEMSQKDGSSMVADYDFVCICSGQFSQKNILTHPGQDAFVEAGGQVMHSSEYSDPSILVDKHVTVLGFSKSATDIAVNAVKAGAKSVNIVYRKNVWRIPYFIGGLINFKRILFIRKQENMFQGWGLTKFDKFKYAIAAPFIWANWRGLEALLTVQLKLNKTGLKPKVRIEDEICCSVPIATPGFFDMVAKGKITAIQGTYKEYSDGALTLTGGEQIKTDISVLAVGFKLGIPYLPEEYRDKLIERDGQYRLHRIILNPDLPDVGFVGFNSSFCTILSAEMGANWLVRYVDGMLEKQPTKAEMNASIDENLDWRRNKRPAAQVYGGLCSAPFHFKHFDELLDDMGAKLRKRNVIAENMAPPNADAYCGYLKSTPEYKAE